LCGSAHAQSPLTPESAAAEFPPYESSLRAVLTRGLATKAAAVALEREPDSVETLKLLLAQDQNRVEDAVAVMHRILATRPERIVPALKVIVSQNHRFNDQARGYPDALQRIAEQARLQLPTLPREDAARLARQIVMIERRRPSAPGANAYDEALAEFMKEYAGTEEALLTQVDVMVRGRVSWEQLENLDTFERAHPASVAGAKALYQEAFQLAVNIPVTGVERRGSDPTERFLRVVAMAKELETGTYPPCEWVDRAPQLVTGFFASHPTYAPGNVDRMAAEYIAFARSHWKTGPVNSVESHVGFLLTTKLADLYQAQGDPTPFVERALDDLANAIGSADAAYLKATFYRQTAINDPQQREAMRTKEKATLRVLSESGADFYQRKALGTLAWLELEDGDYSSALEHFTRYVQRYPQSGYAWAAALRVGASQEAMGNWRDAAASYRAAATTYGSIPLARVLGHEFSARSLEALGTFDEALAEHEQALRGWDPDYGREYSLNSRPIPARNDTIVFEPVTPVTREALERRTSQVRASLRDPAGPLLERGRWLLEHERRTEAIETFAEMLKRFPKSPLSGEAAALSHHARLESAVALANVQATSPDPATALTQLNTLSRERYDEAVCVAGIARATLLALDHADEARSAMQETLTQCRQHAAAAVRPKPPSGLEADVLAVRNAVFLPLGGGVYGSRGWNAFSWPASPPPFLLLNPAIRVKTADGAEAQFVLRDAFPGIDNVVFVSNDQIHLLTGVMTALGGTKKFVPAAIMATPNQPAGAAVDIRAFWSQFFPFRQGHWFGWEFEAYPRIGSIEFLDAGRTRAAVPVTIGYSGATVVLEKHDGIWRAVRLTNEWIT
jgi:tetratricopeptide (TPR) repeat protein